MARKRAKDEFGMQEVGLEYYAFTTNDLTPTILKLKAANPDVLHHIARNQDAILFWRQAREQNFSPVLGTRGRYRLGSRDSARRWQRRQRAVRAARARPSSSSRRCFPKSRIEERSAKR